jgi:flagellar motor switch/type III secretory pathway protein FliN
MTAAAVSAPLEKPANKDAIPADRPDAGDQSEVARWRPVLGLSCQFTVELSFPNFKVADFLTLRIGSVLATNWAATRDVPLRVNGTLIGWGEMEAVGKSLAVRVTELA